MLNFFKNTIILLLLSTIQIQAQSWEELNDEALELYKAGEIQASATILEQALKQAKNESGEADDNYFTALNNLAFMYEELALYQEAEDLYLVLIEKQEALPIPDSLGYTKALNNLGYLYYTTGRYTEAEQTYLKCKELRIEYYSKSSWQYSKVVNNLAVLYNEMGRYEKAAELYEEVIILKELYYGKVSKSYSITLNNMAMNYYNLGELDKAKDLWELCRVTREELYGTEHINYMVVLNNLAMVYQDLGRLNKALDMYQQAALIIKNTLGKNYPEYANILSNIARLHYAKKEYALSETTYLEAMAIYDKFYNKTHPSYNLQLNNYAILLRQQERWEEAVSYSLLATKMRLQAYDSHFDFLSEEEKRALFKKDRNEVFRNFEEIIAQIALAPEVYSTPEELWKTLYNLRLKTKGILLDNTKRIRKNILKSQDSELIEKFKELQNIREQIVKSQWLSKTQLTSQGISIKGLKEQANSLEKELSLISKDIEEKLQEKDIVWEDIRTELKKGEIAIEIIKAAWNYYIVLFITKESQAPEILVFENAPEMEDKYLQYYRKNIKFQKKDTKSYYIYWKPIQDKIKEINPKTSKIYLSQGGVFNQINLNTLYNPESDKYLIDELEIHLLNSTSEILVLASKEKYDKKDNFIFFGKPDYKIDKEDYETEQENEENERTGRAAVSRMLETYWMPLEGTEKEVTSIINILEKKSLKTELFLGAEATESQIKNLESPFVLHIATHGFFIPTQKNDPTESLLQTGLVMAGVMNPYAKNFENSEDGLLTAYEVSGLELNNTKLVVLSACETGLGEIEAGEGVYGLQRAFRVAGAKTIIMSLWKVDDNATQLLMRYFYENWLKLDDPRLAFNKAQKQLRKKYKNPYYWGAFVLVGN